MSFMLNKRKLGFQNKIGVQRRIEETESHFSEILVKREIYTDPYSYVAFLLYQDGDLYVQGYTPFMYINYHRGYCPCSNVQRVDLESQILVDFDVEDIIPYRDGIKVRSKGGIHRLNLTTGTDCFV